MKRTALLLSFVLILTASVIAKTYDKSFIMNIHPNGKLYFVYEMEMPSCDSKRVEKLRYDYTHLDSQVKVSMLATCTTDSAVKVDSMYITLPSGERYEYKVESIYNEANRKGWHNRFRCEIEREVWFNLYDAQQPFSVELRMTNGTTLKYMDSEKLWQKSREKMQFIQEIIKLNKE